MTSLKEIREKLGFDPLDPDYWIGGINEDDNPTPLVNLTSEELDFLFNEAIKEKA